jgi:hypothetical protein
MLPAAVEQGCLDQPGGLVVQVKSSQT